MKAWWDRDVTWTPELIREKYGSYVKGYKLDKGVRKKIKGYIISVKDGPIGYVQTYNAYDFPRTVERHVWTGGCSQDVFCSDAALMYLASDSALSRGGA